MEKKIKAHMGSIKAKMNVIKEHNKKLEEFNYKLESLLVAFDSFAIPRNKQEEDKLKVEKTFQNQRDLVKIKNKSSDSRPIKVQKVETPPFSNLPACRHSVSTPACMKTQPHYTPSKEAIYELSNINTSGVFDSNLQSQDNSSLNELVNRVISSNKPGKVNKMHIIKILGLLNNSKKGMFLDDVIKSSGMSKYKCIDVLNILLKTEPPAITKKFDKGFIYFINLDS